MPGRWIKSQQVEIYMTSRKSGYNQIASCARAGISERSGRAIEQGKWQNPSSQQRCWRTRPDPLFPVWDSELIPLLQSNPQLQPITLLEYLQAHYKDNDGNPIYPDKLLRTLQRRVQQWKAIEGPEQEVMFRQHHEPGRLGLSDFTELKKIIITIQGKPFFHKLYHFRLAYSHWSFLKVIHGGESYSALAEGLQEALWRLGGSPLEHRTDSLSAAFKNLAKEAVQDITQRYEFLCRHYGMKATRNNRGAKHENGAIEAPHGHLKRRIKQALLVRGNRNFESILDYQNFIDDVVLQHNRRYAKAMSLEREVLQKLPSYKTQDYTEITAHVSSSSTIDVRRSTYTVPSRLIGTHLRIRLYDDRLVCYLGATHVVTLNRVHVKGKSKRGRQIDYRHVIHSLVKKPQAFRYSRLREDLLPNDIFRKIWEHVNRTMDAKVACKFIVGLLYLAATEDCEKTLAGKVLNDIQYQRLQSLSYYQIQFKSNNPPLPHIEIMQHPLKSYSYFTSTLEENHGA